MNFQNENGLRDSDYPIMTGLSKENFDKVVEICEQGHSLKTTNRKIPLRTTIGILLVKLRVGCSNSVLSSMFQMTTSGVNKAITRARKVLMKHFVPLNLGEFLIQLVLLLSFH